MNETILVCDDHEDIRNSLEIYLLGEGFRVLTAVDGADTLRQVAAHPVDLIVMDVMMPGIDGIHATLAIRRERSIPIIMLSAKSEDQDKILGLNVGADDYVTKPFNPMELVARIRSQLRRYMQLTGGARDAVLRSGGLALDDVKKIVTVDSEARPLTPVEYKILRVLLERKGEVLSTAELSAQVWGDSSCADNTIAVHIRHIREKIEINPKDPRYLKVVWGHGYKIEDLP